MTSIRERYYKNIIRLIFKYKSFFQKVKSFYKIFEIFFDKRKKCKIFYNLMLRIRRCFNPEGVQ